MAAAVILVVIVVCVHTSFALRSPVFLGRHRGGFLGNPVATEKVGAVPPDQYFSQKLDHFNFVDDSTWQQRYFISSQFYKDKGPVFLMLGGEAEANPQWMVQGQWISYAQSYNALTLMLEHRYYGKSRPTSDLSSSNLQYLNVDQALADVAAFRQFMCEQMPELNSTKWIVFGGSYSGSLAAWYRQKYPHLVDGAVASSAPMYALMNFQGYLEATTQSLYAAGSPLCFGAIYNGSMIVRSMVMYDGAKEIEEKLSFRDYLHLQKKLPLPLKKMKVVTLESQVNTKCCLDVTVQAFYAEGTPGCYSTMYNGSGIIKALILNDRKEMEEKLRLCDKIDPNNMDDVSNLFSVLASNYETVVQYNNDNRQFEGAKGTDITIQKVCEVLTNFSPGKTLIDTYSDVNSMILKAYGLPCLDFKYSKMIDRLKQVDWSSESAGGDRQWMFQTCTEFGFFQTSDSYAQPFGENFPLSFFLQQCTDVFGSQFTEAMLKRGVRRTNLNYGGLQYKGSKVIFPNGSIDPWHTLSITLTDPTMEDITALFVNGTAHCADMYPSSPKDLPQLVQAREIIHKKIGQWLMQ